MLALRTSCLAAVLLLVLPISAFGHATVSPTESRPGAYERYVLRVPNESDAATVRVEITFPTAVRVISFQDVPGWQLNTVMDNTGRALSATWTGTLPPERFVEFPFVAVNPEDSATVSWPVIQTYASGDRVEWTGPRESNSPASVTLIHAPVTGSSGTDWRTWLPMAVACLALVVATAGFVRRASHP